MPPRVPQTIKDLEDAVVLLGAYVQAGGAIRKSRLDRLHELIGMLPRLEDAPKWKRSLKVLRATLVAGAKPSTGV